MCQKLRKFLGFFAHSFWPDFSSVFWTCFFGTSFGPAFCGIFWACFFLRLFGLQYKSLLPFFKGGGCYKAFLVQLAAVKNKELNFTSQFSLRTQSRVSQLVYHRVLQRVSPIFSWTWFYPFLRRCMVLFVKRAFFYLGFFSNFFRYNCAAG